MNLDDKTRKAQVLKYLVDRAGQWVDGPELANERVGGSEGLRRIRELREEGHNIKQRKHPDPQRDIWQYMIPPTVRIDAGIKTKKTPTALEMNLPKFTEIPKRIEFGAVLECDRCKGKGHEPGFKSKTCLRCGGLKVIPHVSR